MGVDKRQKVVLGRGVFARKERVEEARFCDTHGTLTRSMLRDPLDICLGHDRRRAVFVAAHELGDLTGVICTERRACHRVRHLVQTHRLAWCEAEVVRRVLRTEVGRINVHRLRKRHGHLAHLRHLGMQRLCDIERIVVRQVFNNDLERLDHHHETRRVHLEVLPHRLVKATERDRRVVRGDAQLVHKRQNSTGRHTTAAQTNEGIHAWVVPAVHIALVHEFEHLALGHDRTLDRQATVLVLSRLVHIQRITQPFVRFTRKNEFRRAERM